MRRAEVVWDDSPEAVYQEFLRALGDRAGVTLELAVMGGEDADGVPVELSVGEVTEGISYQQRWGFCDGERIHAWIGPDADEVSAVGFLAHELAHLRKADAPPIASQEEAWAELVREIAEEALTLFRERSTHPDAPGGR